MSTAHVWHAWCEILQKFVSIIWVSELAHRRVFPSASWPWTLLLILITCETMCYLCLPCLNHIMYESIADQLGFHVHCRTWCMLNHLYMSQGLCAANLGCEDVGWFSCFMVNSQICQLTDASACRHEKSTRQWNKSHTQTLDVNFCAFPGHVHQTRAMDVVGKGLQVVVSRSDYKCVTQLIGKMTSLSASWPVSELAYLLPFRQCMHMLQTTIQLIGWNKRQMKVLR